MTQPNQPSVAQERFRRSSGRLTASQVIETCATILAGVILLGLAWTNPQPYAPVDLIAGLSGAAALIVGVRLLQAPLIYGTVILIVSTVTVLWAMAGRILPPLLVGVACFGRHHSDCGSRAL